MGKAKIGIEVDEVDLARAEAYVAQHGGSLNELVSTLFASLDREEVGGASPFAPSTSIILLAVSAGKLSIMEAAHQLELPDAGYVLHQLAQRGLPLPRLPNDFVKKQLDEARSALDDCLLEPAKDMKTPEKSRRRTTA